MEIIKVKMTKDSIGSSDGCHVQKYIKGEVYYISEDLANAFIDMEVAKKEKVVKEEVNAVVAETKPAIDEVIEGLGPK